MRAIVVGVALFLAQPQVARAKTSGPLECDRPPKILGWTEDGGKFVFEDCASAEVRAIDVRDGNLLEPDEDEAEQIRKGVKATKPSRLSPDRHARVDVRFKSHDAGRWQNGVFRAAEATVAEIVVDRGSSQPLRTSIKWFSPLLGLEAYWSPDGRRVAAVVETKKIWSAKHHTFEIAIGPARGPRVQWLAPRQIDPREEDQVMDEVERAGFAPTARRLAANKQLDRSIVYAAAGYEKDAERLARAVPGGADVVPLRSDAGAELVVAIGEITLRQVRRNLRSE
jgi:hypothetical protein